MSARSLSSWSQAKRILVSQLPDNGLRSARLPAEKPFSTSLPSNSSSRDSGNHSVAQDSSSPFITNSHPYYRDPGLHSTADAKDLILSVLRSTATKREARQYISRYMPLIGRDRDDILKRREFVQNLLKNPHQTTEQAVFQGTVDQEKFLDAAKASSIAPTPSTSPTTLPFQESFLEENKSFGATSLLRVAIIKLRDIKSIDPDTFLKLGHTIVQLSKLGVSPIIVVDAGKERNDYLHLDNKPFQHYEREIMWKAAAVAGAIESASSDGSVRARPVEGLFELGNSSESDGTATPTAHAVPTRLRFSIPNLILSPLSHGIIPVVVPLAYDPVNSEEKLIIADDAVVFLVNQLTKHSSHIVSVEKIIFIDPLGGIPSVERNGAHVYVNLTQELDDITAELHLGFIDPTSREINLSNLRAMDQALTTLPPTATGLITTPEVASLSSSRNPIIYNILTDRPILSPSLPVIRERTPSISTTILRKGMPVLMIKSAHGIDLLKESKVGTLDLNRLWDLVEDSFGRKLDVDKYLKRINGKVAGVIIAGDYEGAAIITWEEPPKPKESESNAPVIISELDRIYQAAENHAKRQNKRIAYLDKFAVRSSSQGAAGVADVLFKSMVISLFPEELLWRSRKTNPVNKWYFERSRGTMKLPGDSKWCAFWTGSQTREKEKLNDYIEICSSIPDSWKS